MSYNGVGLQTARGSGTSGYVETNLAAALNKSKSFPDELVHGHYKRRKLLQQEEERRQRHAAALNKKKESQAEIFAHHDKRHIDLKCAELRDQLEDELEDELVIMQKVDALRKHLTNQAKSLSTNEDELGGHIPSNLELPVTNINDAIERVRGIAPATDKSEKAKYTPRHTAAINPRVRRE